MGLAAPGLRLGIDRLRLRKVRWLGGGLAKAASSEKGNPEAWSPCRQDVGSTCPDVAGRQTTAAGVGGPVTCNDTPSTGVRGRPRLHAGVGCFDGS